MEEVKTNLFSKCVYNISKQNEKLYNYYHFFGEFYKRCINVTNNVSKFQCAREILTGLTLDEVDKCIAISFVSTSNKVDLNLVDNILLDEDYKYAVELKAKTIPEIFVNRQAFWGDLNAKNLLEAICAGINRKPEICYNQGGFSKESKISTWLIVLTIIAIVLGVSVVIFILCKRLMTKSVKNDILNSELDLKVNTVVTSYLALKDKN